MNRQRKVNTTQYHSNTKPIPNQHQHGNWDHASGANCNPHLTLHACSDSHGKVSMSDKPILDNVAALCDARDCSRIH
eukprot:m.189843 g.189843  ORF g.189843 m.189843 type:complete len:77 (-) comp32388_c2_seq2:1501-1731(-)